MGEISSSAALIIFCNQWYVLLLCFVRWWGASVHRRFGFGGCRWWSFVYVRAFSQICWFALVDGVFGYSVVDVEAVLVAVGQ